MPLEILRNDITRVHAEAIVNSANPQPVIGRGVDSSIHAAAGPKLLVEREAIGSIAVGHAAITNAGELHARYVIHTVGPVWEGNINQAERDLARCYRSSLELAWQHDCASIAFPLISTGAYGFPKDLALRVATDTIRAFLLSHDMDAYLVVYDPESFEISKARYGKVASFIESSYHARSYFRAAARHAASTPEPEAMPCMAIDAAYPREEESAISSEPQSLEDAVSQVDQTFSESLLQLIDKRGLTDPEVCKRANIDRKLFSKIRSNAFYQPRKQTALALAVALELDLDETRDLIGRAGYALTHASKADLIVEYFILNGEHDILLINEALFAFDQPLVGR